jgi:pre-rRNA-processing protein TSR1
MANEQTWPTAEELAEGEAREAKALTMSVPAKKSKIKRVPRGTSTYQAAWIVDDADDEDDYDEDGNGNDDADMEAKPNAEEDQENEEEDMVELDEEAEDDQAMSVTNSKAGKSVAFEDMDVEEEARQCVSPIKITCHD